MADALAIVLLFVVVLALAGIFTYLFMDYNKFKTKVDTEHTDAQTKMTSETNNRMSNVKYVVDQVNSVNKDIANTFTSNIAAQNARLTAQEAWKASTISAINQTVQFTSNTGSVFDLWGMPGAVAPDIQLINHVTAMSGLTVNGLDKAGPAVKFCAPTAAGGKCIMFPDTNGNTTLTGFSDNSSILMQSPTLFNSNITFSPLISGFKPSSSDTMTMFGTTDGIIMNTNKVAVGPQQTTPFVPTATLHIVGAATTANALQVGVGTTPPMAVTSAGGIQATSVDLVGYAKPSNTTSAIFTTDTKGNLVINANVVMMGSLTNSNAKQL